MKIIVNTRSLQAGHVTGVQRYTLELLKNIQKKIEIEVHLCDLINY